MIKFDRPLLNFGEVAVNDHREIVFYIENKHKSLPIDIVIPRTPLFKVTPQNIKLEPYMNSSFIASFMPNNVGRYNKNLEITLL
jgi:hypothetical protein